MFEKMEECFIEWLKARKRNGRSVPFPGDRLTFLTEDAMEIIFEAYKAGFLKARDERTANV